MIFARNAVISDRESTTDRACSGDRTAVSGSAIAIVCLLLTAFPCIVRGQSDSWHSLPPNIVDKSALMKQHYGRKGFAVLDDTISEGCCDGPLWVVLGTTIIPSGRQLTIPEGTRVLFEPGASLVVEGTLLAAGTPGARVEFMPVPLSERYMVLDSVNIWWGGISVGATGKLDLRHALLRDASKGISSLGPCDSLIVKHTEFSGIPGTVLTYDNATPAVPLGQSFTSSCPTRSVARPAMSPALQTTSNALLAGSGVAAAAGALFYLLAYRADHEILDGPTTHDRAQRSYDTATGLYRASAAALVTSGVCLAAGAGLKLTFTLSRGTR